MSGPGGAVSYGSDSHTSRRGHPRERPVREHDQYWALHTQDMLESNGKYR